MKVLVAYATAKGSTRGIAERLGSCIEGSGRAVDVRSAADVSQVHSYDVIVLGSAIHDGQWLVEASDAVERLRSQLEGKRVWAFSVSSVGVTSTTLSRRLARFLRRVTPELGRCRCCGTRPMCGTTDSLPGRLPRVTGPASDGSSLCSWVGTTATPETGRTCAYGQASSPPNRPGIRSGGLRFGGRHRGGPTRCVAGPARDDIGGAV